MYRILVAGAGYVGGEVARYFRRKGQRVWGLVRTEASAAALEKDGIIPILADLTKPETLQKIPIVHFVLISAAPHGRSDENYSELYLNGIGNLLKCLNRKLPPELVVYTSSTSVWKERGGEWVDESVPPDADTQKGKILIEAEKQVLQSGFPSIIFRLAGIYGPGRNRLKAFQAGEWPAKEKTPENPYMNLIHRDDIVSAMQILFKKAAPGKVYLGVDQEPVLRSELAKWVAEKLGIPFKPPIFESITGKRCRNHSLLELGFQFQYPTFREGYRSLINA